MFKRSLSTLICFSLTFLTTACQAEKKITIPDKPLEISLSMTAKELYESNLEYKKHQSADAQPMDTVFRGFNFPSGSTVESVFSYPSGSIEINNVATVRAMGEFSIENFQLPKINITTFLRGNDSNNITDKEAYDQVQKIFKQLESQGWEYNFGLSSPRVSPENAVKYALTGGSTSYLDYRYPLSLDEFNQITSYLHKWYLRHGTDTYLQIEMWRNTEENGDTTILFSYKFYDESEEINRYIDFENGVTAMDSFVEHYNQQPHVYRLSSESSVVKKDIPLDKSLSSHTFPSVKQETGFDTAKIINTDPYKITHREFMERYEKGEDMTSYYENQPKAKPEITSQARGRCLAGQPCPKSGYWFTLANSDSRAYFKKGDIMPDYPNNQWGEVIWQFEGEEG
ncbi:hypothetical protein ACT3TI_13420 [Psychrobacter sp. AOP22-C1-22]|uniref:hypothetical protein n=1 Tax=unclassified Psychrobacter TaxID=196806 RepID=UPI00178784AD|nr:hypothetical protein [Psychrobacter sp. FME6]MBE0407889.1 hypothetical protein [Psychrobacter sp. FME6]